MEIQKEELNLNNNDINKSMKNSQSTQNKDREKKEKNSRINNAIGLSHHEQNFLWRDIFVIL